MFCIQRIKINEKEAGAANKAVKQPYNLLRFKPAYQYKHQFFALFELAAKISDNEYDDCRGAVGRVVFEKPSLNPVIENFLDHLFTVHTSRK